MRIEIVKHGPGAWSVHVKDRNGRLMFSSPFVRSLRTARRRAAFLALPLDGLPKVIER